MENLISELLIISLLIPVDQLLFLIVFFTIKLW